jgi:hypothetical protein
VYRSITILRTSSPETFAANKQRMSGVGEVISGELRRAFDEMPEVPQFDATSMLLVGGLVFSIALFVYGLCKLRQRVDRDALRARINKTK